MDIINALKETGKARWHRWIGTEYVFKKGVLFFYTDGKSEEEPYNFDSLLDNNWQPYPDKKEIRPEKAGELWERNGEQWATVRDTRTSVPQLLMCNCIKDYKDIEESNTWKIIHNQNGWKLLYSPDKEVMKQLKELEDENVERIEIENVSWRERDEGYTYPITFGDSSHPNLMWKDLTRKPDMKIILEIPKDE
jgi:hypothetical protein